MQGERGKVFGGARKTKASAGFCALIGDRLIICYVRILFIRLAEAKFF
jgi:hypothetical protein